MVDAPRSRPDRGEGGREVLACRLCSAPITTRRAAIQVDGAHEHTFFNPAGVLYEIACYGSAPGCAVVGAATAEFSWFPGFRWSLAGCGSCGAQLGWRFDGPSSGFFGLITNRLVETEPDGPGESGT